MSFTSGIPATGQSLGGTRDDIRNNFTNYFNTVSQDHVAPGGAAGQGKHKQSTYTVLGSDPTTLANEAAFYSKSVSGAAEFFLRRESNGNVIQMSVGTPVINAPAGSFLSTGSTFLPGGYILNFGIYTTGGDGVSITYTTPFTTVVVSVVITIASNSTVLNGINVVESSLSSLTDFKTAKTSGGSSNYPISFWAIGK